MSDYLFIDNKNKITYSTNSNFPDIFSNIKWYVHQMITRLDDDIIDFIDDDKDGNRSLIGELKEDREKWKDIDKLLNGESLDNLYMDWRKFGEYE